MGIAVIIIGLALSIGLHEFGHLIPAKLFGVRVPNWAIGFGPKLFGKKIGETEYSFRLIPLGGYITMIGMYPPDTKNKDSKRRFGKLIAASRDAHSEHMQPGDAGVRTLYSLPAWKRIIVMFGGPFTNLLLGFIFVAIAASGLGPMTQTSKLDSVVACVAKFENQDAVCKPGDETPAVLAGLKAGDEILAINGVDVTLGAQVTEQVAKSSGPISIKLLRAGKPVEINVSPVEITLQGETRKIVGVTFVWEHRPVPLTRSVAGASEILSQTATGIINFPVAVYSSIATLVQGTERDPNGAVSIVGVAQIAGQTDDFFNYLMLLGSLNFALFAFNMIPLPPLDGGHIAGGVYEYLKRGWYRIRGKKLEGYVDTALMAPVAQIMFIVLLVAGVLMMVTDSINPIHL